MGCSKPAIMRSVVVLPQPDGPSIEKNSPRWISKFGVVDRDEAAEALGHVVDLDDRRPAVTPARASLALGAPAFSLHRRESH